MNSFNSNSLFLFSGVSSVLPPSGKSGMASWSPFVLLPQLLTILIVTFLIMILCWCYNRSLKKTVINEAPTGIVLFAEISIKWVERQVVDLMGTKYKFLTVYMIYILMFAGIGNLMPILGFESIVTAYTVPLTLGLVAFFGIYYFGLKYQKWAFFQKFLVNPLEIIQQFVPLISISFRLFGNTLGGSIIILLLSQLLGFIWGKIPFIGPVDLLSGMILPFLSIYFDMFDGLIQSYIFAILTITYWAMEMQETKKESKIKNKERVISVDLNRSNYQLKFNKETK